MTGTDQQPPTWVFGREAVLIRLQRLPGLRMRIESSEGHEREFDFPEIGELTAFQCGFERHLVETGWSLLEFSPERRRLSPNARWPRRERRRYPIRDSDSDT